MPRIQHTEICDRVAQARQRHDGVEHDARPLGKGRHTDGGAAGAAIVAEQVGHQIVGGADHVVHLVEPRSGVDVAGEVHERLDAVEVAEHLVEVGEGGEQGEARRLLGVVERHVDADLSRVGDAQRLVERSEGTGRERQVAVHDHGAEPAASRQRRRKPQTEITESFRNGHRVSLRPTPNE